MSFGDVVSTEFFDWDHGSVSVEYFDDNRTGGVQVEFVFYGYPVRFVQLVPFGFPDVGSCCFAEVVFEFALDALSCSGFFYRVIFCNLGGGELPKECRFLHHRTVFFPCCFKGVQVTLIVSYCNT